jgi:hypothetical protein
VATTIAVIENAELAVEHETLRDDASTQEQRLVTITSREASEGRLDQRVEILISDQDLVEWFLEPEMLAHGSTVVILRGRPRGLPVAR